MAKGNLIQSFPVSENARECYNNNGTNAAKPDGEGGAKRQCCNREQLETAVSGLDTYQKVALYELLQDLLQSQSVAVARAETAATEEASQ